jgi:hypothetical protein
VGASSEMEAFGAIFEDPAAAASIPSFECWIAPTEQNAGHPDKADGVLRTSGHFVDCYRFRGDILEQKAYAEAIALAPDLPAGYYSLGVALAKHGDFGGAEADFQNANCRGPHWADPLKAWGDLLMKQGKGKTIQLTKKRICRPSSWMTGSKVSTSSAGKNPVCVQFGNQTETTLARQTLAAS